jgi:hypothetical protein
MKRESPIDLLTLREESFAVEKAVQAAVRDALLDHKRRGNSIVECDDDGRVRRVPAAEIDFDEARRTTNSSR